jgi:1-deoxy-D-xylulose 5-phosphate reductoisomerase
LRFTAIAATIERVLEAYDPAQPSGIDEVLEIDRRAREVATGMLPN